MNLRERAALDIRWILENRATGFGWAVTVTDPEGASAELAGHTTDIHTIIDPETGLAVSGRQASVALPIAALTEAGLALPKGVASRDSKPWLVTFDNIGGTQHTFKVKETRPDQAAGVVVCMLEAYRTA